MFGIKTKVDLSELEELTKRYPEASREARVMKLTEAVNLLEAAVKKETPYGAGPIHLRDTEHSSVKVSGEKVAGIVGTPAKYGEPVEMGTKPHFPPIGPIQFWVEKKLGLSGKEATSAAFGIAMAMSGKGARRKRGGKRMTKPWGGTKGAKMFETGFEEQEARVMAILNEILEEIVRRVSG